MMMRASTNATAVKRSLLPPVDDEAEDDQVLCDAALDGLPAPLTRSDTKRRRLTSSAHFPSTPNHPHMPDPFDLLPDDIVLSILACLSSQARSPADLLGVALTCKRLRELGSQARVLAVASRQAIAVRASMWCPSAHTFLKRCAESGNADAALTLGMIEFYCLSDKVQGLKLLEMGAASKNADALYALAVLKLNGSISNSGRRDAQGGVAMCVRAAMAGSMEAMRELGHCFKEGIGVRRDERAAKELLLEVNRREAMFFVNANAATMGGGSRQKAAAGGAPIWREMIRHCLASDCGCPLPLGWLLQRRHPAHRFLSEWQALQHCPLPMNIHLRQCCNALCGRSEVRPLEFGQCAACRSAFYCSHSCQSMDWKLRHLLLCQPSMPSLLA